MTDHPELLNLRNFSGRVEWIGTTSTKSGPLAARDKIEVVANSGIVGEHHFRENSKSHRQVTLIQKEHLSVIAELLEVETVDPADLRRNIVVSGINLAALDGREFRIGSAVMKGTGDCPPCNRMEKNLGQGGYEAMVGHGGLTCVVVEGGEVACGDAVIST